MWTGRAWGVYEPHALRHSKSARGAVRSRSQMRSSHESLAPPAPPAPPSLILPPSALLPHIRATSDEEGALTYALALDPAPLSPEPPLDAWLCVPGVPGAERDFRHLAPHLARHAPVARVVFPGFGPLSDHAASSCPTSSEERARYLSRVISAEGWGRVGVIGHSMGGAAALALAARDPRVGRLCLVCSVGLRRHRAMRLSPRAARAVVALTRAPLVGRALISAARAQLLAMGFRGHPLHAEQLRLIYAHVAAIDFDGLRRDVARLPEELDARLVWTSDDPLIEEGVSEELAAAIRARLPRARLTRLEGGGHAPQRWRPAELAALLG